MPINDLQPTEVTTSNGTTIQVSPPITPPGKKLTESERLAVENIFLKMQNLQLQVKNYDNEKLACLMQLKELQKEMEEKRSSLSLKYGVDISNTTVAADGTIREKS